VDYARIILVFLWFLYWSSLRPCKCAMKNWSRAHLIESDRKRQSQREVQLNAHQINFSQVACNSAWIPGVTGGRAPSVLQQAPCLRFWEKWVGRVWTLCRLFYFVCNKILVISIVHNQIYWLVDMPPSVWIAGRGGLEGTTHLAAYFLTPVGASDA